MDIRACHQNSVFLRTLPIVLCLFFIFSKPSSGTDPKRICEFPLGALSGIVQATASESDFFAQTDSGIKYLIGVEVELTSGERVKAVGLQAVGHMRLMELIQDKYPPDVRARWVSGSELK